MCSFENNYFPAMMLLASIPPLTVVVCQSRDKVLRDIAAITLTVTALLLTFTLWWW